VEIVYGFPFRGSQLEAQKAFLESRALAYDDGVDFSVCALEDGRIIGTGSLDKNVLKCVAVSPAVQNEGVAAKIITELVNHAAQNNRFHLFLFTKPEHFDLFSSLGFYAIAQTEDALLMENKRDGIARFVDSLEKPRISYNEGNVGVIVANCNPFTNGHLYLCESAARQCDVLHVFILSEDKSEFPAEVRRSLAKKGTAHIPNVVVQPTGPYVISAATFPDYFLKKLSRPADANIALDLTIFGTRLAPPLHITKRFVGTEPFSDITARYNQLMKEILPRYGISVTEIPRVEIAGAAVSASRVRSLLRENRLAEIEPLVPTTTFEYLAKLGVRE
jgi:[citrate (pro-3S)-lyase] ligase